ncbi:Protoporphyrinogen oxidase [compost metagenome]
MRQTLGITALPDFHWVCRWPQAIPQYHVGHLARLRRIEELLEKHPGLFLGGNAFRGVSLNDCTRDAKQIAAAVCRDLSAEQRP